MNRKKNVLTKCNPSFLVVETASLTITIIVVLEMFDRLIQTFMFLRYAISSELSLEKAIIIKKKVSMRYSILFTSYIAMDRLLKYVPLYALKKNKNAAI